MCVPQRTRLLRERCAFLRCLTLYIARRWVFTINNPHAQFTEDDYAELRTNLPLRYLCASLENAPTTGTFHLQGYAEFSKPVRRSAFLRVFGKCYCAPARGTPEEASDYCLEDPNAAVFGDLGKGQGARSELLVLRDDVIAGVSDEAIIRNDVTAGAWLKYRRGVSDMRKIFAKPEVRTDIKVALFYGPPGTGKSTYAREIMPNAYMKDNTKWWEGYDGEEEVIWNEFGGWSCTPSAYNSIFDVDKLQVEPKGGFVPFRGRHFIITSNYLPEEWWSTEKARVCLSAVTRRINRYVWFQKLGEEPLEFDDYSAFDTARNRANYRPVRVVA